MTVTSAFLSFSEGSIILVWLIWLKQSERPFWQPACLVLTLFYVVVPAVPPWMEYSVKTTGLVCLPRFEDEETGLWFKE